MLSSSSPNEALPMQVAKADCGGGVQTPLLADPCFLLQNGKPTYFYAPSGINVRGGRFTEIYCMKVHYTDPSVVLP
jgi:hypothetical protein